MINFLTMLAALSAVCFPLMYIVTYVLIAKIMPAIEARKSKLISSDVDMERMSYSVTGIKDGIMIACLPRSKPMITSMTKAGNHHSRWSSMSGTAAA